MSRRSAIGAKAERFHTRDTIELDVEVWPRPICSGPRRIGNTHVQRCRVASGVTQPPDNALLELFIALEHGREPRALSREPAAIETLTLLKGNTELPRPTGSSLASTASTTA